MVDLENICVYCMNELSPNEQYCSRCGREKGTYVCSPYHLPPLSILKGRYLLGKSIGEGGFGITYIALDLYQDQRVAIKELFVQNLLSRENRKTVLVHNDNDSRKYYQACKAKFLQEAKLLQNLEDKQGVVDFRDSFEENNTVYIVMEYLPGDDLTVYLKKRGGRIPFREAFKLLKPVMKSVMMMNEVGVFHKDIAPDNIRYMTNGQMKIMDLGSAKYTYQEQVRDASFIVTLKKGYAPPEQYVGGYKIGPWMDVYAMAATIYRCITGKVPTEALSRMENDELEPPSLLGAEINRETEQVLMKALALKVEDRYMDMRGFYTALKNANPEFEEHKKKKKEIVGKINREAEQEKAKMQKAVIAWILLIGGILLLFFTNSPMV